ncbi:hypothetical protein BSLG_007240 [Batrachochytrium salamandrivorans]|nr:hypothetical protein BSLG_007240 [Batrachochytrium salamandrivorans]
MSQLPPDKSVQDTPAAMPGHPEIIETAQVSSSALSDSLSDSYPYHLLDPLQLSGSKSQKIQKKASMIDQRYLRIAENSSPDTQASTPLFNLSSKIATSTSEHLHKYPHPPSSRPSLDARRLSSAAGSSIGRTRLKSQALALRRWDMLRVKILQGRFRLPKTKQKAAAMPQDDFVAVVSTLWELLLRSRTLSGHASTSTGVDNASELIKSTDPLNMSSYQAALSATLVTPKSPASSAPGTSRDMGGAASESHTPRSAHSKPKRAGLGATPPDTSHKYAGSTLFVNGGVVGTEKSAWKLPTIGLLSCSVAPASTSYLGKCVGLEGLSLDSISKSNIGHALAIIANGLGSLQHDGLDFFAIKVHINRGWKLLILGLAQAEPFSRYQAMIALERSLPFIDNPLVDNKSRFSIVSLLTNLAVSDERKENQLRAIYLLGKIGSELQKVQEYHTLLQMAFKELSRMMLAIQYHERQESLDLTIKYGTMDKSVMDKKVYLFHAIGKYTRIFQKHSNSTEDLVLYMIYQELSLVTRILASRNKSVLDQTDPEVHIVLSVLGILNNDMEITAMNKKYVGALFKKSVNSLMQSSYPVLQKMAVQFICSWLPIVNEDAILQGIECIQSGLLYSKSLNVPNFDADEYSSEVLALEKWKYSEKCCVSMRSKLLRELIRPPGTVSKFLPVPGCPGFFCDSNSSLLNTKSVLIDLPIHKKSNVTLTRLIPSIPGVPDAVTTIPPLFIDKELAESLQQPHSSYEFLERVGGIPSLTFGYTYFPNPLVDSLDPLQQISRREALSAKNLKISDDSTTIPILKNPKLWENFDEIPRGTTRIPPKTDYTRSNGDMDTHHRKYPYGFSTICPFPGFDPERIDRNSHSISPIYGKQMTEMHGFTGIVDSNLNVLESRNSAASSRDEKHMGYKQSSKVSGQDLHNLSVAKMSRASVLNSPQIDPGYTYAQHPILWPSRNPTLKSPQYSTDFLLNSPVLFDIIQPHSPDLQRILTRVVGLDKDISRITVQQSSSRMGVLSNGTRFSIYIRERSDLSRWIAVQLMVIDDNYQDNFDFYGSTSSMKSSWSSIHHISSSIKSNTTAATGNTATNEAAIVRGATTSTKTSENAFPFPIPAGFTSLNVPYFAPPVNIPPFPVGYDDKCRPYYGRQPHVKPIPLGVSNFGTRFYSGDGTLVEGGQRNILAGIDVYGYPFFVPRGFSIPAPSGFTTDGIPYYDVLSIMRNRGIMLLPSTFQVVESYYSDDSDDWEELLPKLHRPTFVVSPIQRQRIEALFLEKLTSSLHGTQPLLKHAMTQARRWSTDSVQTISKNAIVQRNSKKGIAEMDMQDPVDIPEFLRSGLEFSYLKPNSMRVIIEPAQMEFQSVHTTITKTLTLRYRAMRGDHGECDVFLAIDPVDVFSLDSFHLKLQGEGLGEIVVTYNPRAMKSERVEGGIYLIDEYGKRMATCQLLAQRECFFKIHPGTLNFGWVLPERQKESTFIVENLASASVLLNLFIKSEAIQMVKNSYVDLEGNSRPQSKDSIKKSVFSLPVTSIRLQPLETKTIVVYFNPSSLGLIKDTIEVRGPGGDVSFVDVVGMAGIPIAIFPESETNSLIGADVLSRERAKFISKYKQQEYNVDGPGIFNTEEELQVINSIKAAQSNGESRRNAHTLDFGICSLNTKVLVRCLTFMNLGDTPATISLFSHHPNVACPYLVRIAPHKANTIEVTLTVGEGASGVRGNLHSVIEIACPEFQNIPVHVKSFIGQALYFPVWENVFFKPCRIGQMQQLSISLINESQYDLSVVLDGIGSLSNVDNSGFTTTLSTNDSDPTLAPAFALIPVIFTFYAKGRGPLMTPLSLRIITPFQKLVPAAMFMRQMRLFGVYDYPTDDQREYLFDLNGSNDSCTETKLPEFDGDAFDVMFKTDPYITETQDNVAYGYHDGLGGINSSKSTLAVDTLAVQNRGKAVKNVRFIASTGFAIDPKYRTLQPGEMLKLESHFNAPPDIGRLVTVYGFAAALDESDNSICSTQMIKRFSSGILVLPLLGSDHNMVIDFGKIELSGETMTESSKMLLLCNPHSTTYAWNIKFVTAKNKFNPFETPITSGDVTGYDTFTVPFKFKCDVSGLYETTCEVYISDIADKFGKSAKVGTVILRGASVNTSLSGIPDSIDFGAVVISNMKRKVFTLSNNGTSDLHITSLVRSPFTVIPRKFTLSPKAQIDIQLSFKPTETRNIRTNLQVFANQKLFLIPIMGLGGDVDLACEKHDKRTVEFGEIREGTIGWCSIYLTNKGTLPLILKAVTSHSVGVSRLRFVSLVTSIPTDSSNPKGSPIIEIKKDYWGMIRRNYSRFKVMSGLELSQTSAQLRGQFQGVSTFGKMKKAQKVFRNMDTTRALTWASVVPIHHPTTISVANSTIKELPELMPLSSYHFLLGYTATHRASQNAQLQFHYMPVISDDGSTDIPLQELLKYSSLNFTGTIYRPLELKPDSYDFGYAPAERYLETSTSNASNTCEPDSYGVVSVQQSESSAVFNLEVINMSLISQDLSLRSISPEFFVSQRAWLVQAGEKLIIPVEFHPPREQIQFQGEAIFLSKYGISTINLFGTGASAEIVADEMVDFGSIKIHSKGQQTLRIYNRGLLESKVQLDIIQSGSEYRFIGNDPYEDEGTVSSGGVLTFTLECQSTHVEGSMGAVVIKWRRVPKGVIETLSVPLKVQIGYPAFRMHSLEVDFKTTFIDVNKTLGMRLYNEGNASCSWKAECETSHIMMNMYEGSIAAGGSMLINITYAPSEYETLSSAIRFFTDAGNPTLMCYGVVGVPYLKVPPDSREIDFGTITIEHTHTRSFAIANTGTKVIEYEIATLCSTKDGIEVVQDQHDTFYFDPIRSVVQPGQPLLINISIYAREYNVIYASKFIIRTMDGEQYNGQVTAKGGKAIIKISPPKMPVDERKQALQPETISSGKDREIKSFTEKSRATRPPPANTEVFRNVFQSHLDNLYEVLAGLRTAELHVMENSEVVQEDPLISPQQAIDPTRKPSEKQKSLKNDTSKSSAITLDSASVGRDVSLCQDETDFDMLDGSNLRLRSRGRAKVDSPISNIGVEPHIRSKFKQITASESNAVKYTDELTQLERELEIAIGLRDPAAFTPTEGGTSSGTIDMNGLITQTGDTESKPGSPGKRSAGGLGKYQPGRRRGVVRHEEKEPTEYDLMKLSGSDEVRGETPLSVEAPMTLQESAISNTPRSKELVSVDMSDATRTSLAEIQGQKREIENILQIAQEMTRSIGTSLDSTMQMELLEKMSDRILTSTNSIVQAVQGRVSTEKWVPNRDFIQQALRRLQMSTIAIENYSEPEPEQEIEENLFNMGLVRGGNMSDSILLFSIPNEGNIGFEYTILHNPDECIMPYKYSLDKSVIDGLENMVFRLNPVGGSLQPGEFINISATFQAAVVGAYRQGYSVMSGDDTILKFSVMAHVGVPNLAVISDIVDFGLVEKGQSVSKVINLSNNGGYPDFWRIEQSEDSNIVGDFDSSDSPFKFSESSGDINAGHSSLIRVDFNPLHEGQFKCVAKIIWSNNPILITIMGIGGGCKLDIEFDTKSDKMFGGLDFGICPVGLAVSKNVKITNIGTVKGCLELSHRNSCVTLSTTRDDTGGVYISPGSSINLTVTLTPEISEIIKDPIVILLGTSGSHYIPLKSRCGIHDWRIDNTLDFLNAPILESQYRTLSIVNTGTLDLSFDVKIEPIELASVVSYSLSGDNWIEGRPLRPKQTAAVLVKAISDHQSIVDGKLVVTSTIRGKLVDLQFPLKFRIFVDEICLDDSGDIDVGRVMIGESATVIRSISNFGNSKTRYRIQIERNDGDTKPTSWSIKSASDGYLEAGENNTIEVVFESLDGFGDDWQQENMIIELCSGDNLESWLFFSKIKLIGASGHASLEFEPSEIDFGPTGIGSEKTMQMTFRNDGNAVLNYEVQTPWESSDEVTLSLGFSLKGAIKAKEVLSTLVTFSPVFSTNYSTVIYIKTSIGDRSFNVHGEGVSYQLYRDSLPDIIDFGDINVAETRDIQLSMENDCNYDIDVSVIIYEENPSEVDYVPKRSEYVNILPKTIRIKGNDYEGSRSKALFTVRASANIQYTESGLVSNEVLQYIPINRRITYYLCVDVVGGRTEIIPIEGMFSVKPVLLLSQFLNSVGFNSADIVSNIDFGPTQFVISPLDGLLNPVSSKDITLDFLGASDLQDGLEVPKSEQHSALLNISMLSDFLTPLSIPLTGILVDQAPELDLPDDIDFGGIYRLKKFKIVLDLYNPTKRSLRWHIYLDPAFAEIFLISGQSEDTTPAKTAFTVGIVFNPKAAVSYKATAFMESDAGNFTIDLFGEGIQPRIDVDQTAFSFGVVGINDPEYKDIVVTNPLDLRLRIRVRSDNSHFSTNINEFELSPSESYTVRVYFSPTIKARHEQCGIAFFNLDDMEDGSDDYDVDSNSDLGSTISNQKEAIGISKASSPRKELDILKEVRFDGIGGSFSLRAESTGTAAHHIDDTTIRSDFITISFPKLNRCQSSRKSFEIENTGDTVLNMGVFDMDGKELIAQNDVYSNNRLCKYQVSPNYISVPPNSKRIMTVMVEGVDVGKDMFEFMVKTRTLLNPKAITIHVDTNILSSDINESLRAFVRADVNMNQLFSIALQEEDLYAIERDLWKVLLPIVRVSAVPASQEYQTVVAVEPVVTRPDIGPYVVRPPAIPKELPPQTKKWYMNRVSMTLESSKVKEVAISENSIRRNEALEFVRPLEKKMPTKHTW